VIARPLPIAQPVIVPRVSQSSFLNRASSLVKSLAKPEKDKGKKEYELRSF